VFPAESYPDWVARPKPTRLFPHENRYGRPSPVRGVSGSGGADRRNRPRCGVDARAVRRPRARHGDDSGGSTDDGVVRLRRRVLGRPALGTLRRRRGRSRLVTATNRRKFLPRRRAHRSACLTENGARGRPAGAPTRETPRGSRTLGAPAGRGWGGVRPLVVAVRWGGGRGAVAVLCGAVAVETVVGIPAVRGRGGGRYYGSCRCRRNYVCLRNYRCHRSCPSTPSVRANPERRAREPKARISETIDSTPLSQHRRRVLLPQPAQVGYFLSRKNT
jgi:hypothetical protein